MNLDLTGRSAVELAALVSAGELRAIEITEAFLQRIAAHNEGLNAYVEVFSEDARKQAEAVDRARKAGARLGLLAGVPVALKDIYAKQGKLTTCASRILAGFRAPYTATAVARLEAAGAVILGRTNMDEFAMGSSTEQSIYGVTRNPFDLTRSTGGSSGGSACAVSARLATLALGTDTGGSVRQPAAFCGITGFKPTYGRISRYGMVAFASSLDHVAPFAHSAMDIALCMQVLAGKDPLDSTSLAEPVPDYRAATQKPFPNMRIGIPDEYFTADVDPEVDQLTRAAIDRLVELGAETVSVSMPHTRYAIPSYYLVCCAEASSNLARYDGVRYGLRAGDGRDLDNMYAQTRGHGFGSEVKLRILLGTYCLCSGYYDAFYLKASKLRSLLRQDFATAFESCDLLAAPTTPTPAFELGEKLDDPLAMYQNDILTAPANLAGIPAISVPCGFSAGGLPVGLQLIGPALGEERVLQAAAAYQDATAHHRVEPACEEAT